MCEQHVRLHTCTIERNARPRPRRRSDDDSDGDYRHAYAPAAEATMTVAAFWRAPAPAAGATMTVTARSVPQLSMQMKRTAPGAPKRHQAAVVAGTAGR